MDLNSTNHIIRTTVVLAHNNSVQKYYSESLVSTIGVYDGEPFLSYSRSTCIPRNTVLLGFQHVVAKYSNIAL